MNKSIKTLADLLSNSPRFAPHDMLRWFLSSTLHLMGVAEWMAPPDEARQRVEQVITAYDEAVASEVPFTDIHGPLYMELGSRGGRAVLGQYFTPQPIARMMAEMMYGNSERQDGRLLAACDPAVGSGVMMLTHLQCILDRHGPEALKAWSITGIDLDPVCSRMFALQLLASCNVHRLQVGEIIVYEGNALGSPSEFKAIVHASCPEIPHVAPAMHPARIEAVKEAVKQKFQQLDMFENVG